MGFGGRVAAGQVTLITVLTSAPSPQGCSLMPSTRLLHGTLIMKDSVSAAITHGAGGLSLPALTHSFP